MPRLGGNVELQSVSREGGGDDLQEGRREEAVSVHEAACPARRVALPSRAGLTPQLLELLI